MASLSSPEVPAAPTAGSTTTATEPVDLTASSPHSLQRAIRSRRAEYVRPHRIRVKVGTWNVAACPGTDKDLASWFISGQGVDQKLASVDLARNSAVERDDESGGPKNGDVRLVGGDKIGLYVLGLQEVVDLNAVGVVSRVYGTDNGVIDKWKSALETALPDGYQLVACEQLIGMLLLIYASPEVAPTVSNVSTASVGTGMLYMGNKGAVSTRLVLGETTRMVFVNCHLASGSEATHLDRRIWDVGQVLSRTSFQPIVFSGVAEDDGEKIGDEDFGFWFGDLNFRLDGLPGDDIRRLLMLHTRGEYAPGKMRKEDSLEGEIILVDKASDSSESKDSGSILTRSTDPARGTLADEDEPSVADPEEYVPDPHEDPLSLQATLDSLLPHDQLQRMMKERKVFYEGWREGPITFLPSYKYDVGTVGLFDSSEKRRAPSWCDRILYRTRKDRERYEVKIQEEEQARKRDEEMKAEGLEDGGDDEILFDIGDDPQSEPSVTDNLEYDEYDEGNDDSGEEVITKDGFVDHIHLDIYTSHQRITSSDHKPIISVFTLDYDAVVPELKAEVYADVARELDRAENEGRPTITVVVDSDGSVIRAESHGTLGSADLVVDFGEVHYMRKDISSLTVANTGRVPATFAFVDKPTTNESDNFPSGWLSASFARSDMDAGADVVELGKEVTLEPGETVKAILQTYVDNTQHARMLNDGHATPEEVLVLRVTDGRDHFIPVRAAWVPTCIGRSVEELIRVPDGGVRAFVKSFSTTRGWVGGTGSVPYDLAVQSAAPKELFKLTEFAEAVADRALADEQMLEDCKIPRSSGWPFDEITWQFRDKEARLAYVAAIVDALDGDRPLSEAFPPETPSMQRLEVICEALLLFLRALTDGIVTMPLWARIEQAHLPSIGWGSAAPKPATDEAAEDDRTAILDIMSSTPNHSISLVFLTSSLAKIISELAPLTKADIESLKSDPPVQGIRRSLSFFVHTAGAEAAAALEQRKAREKKVAEVLGKVVCRAPIPDKEKERKALEDRQRALVELFLRRREGG